MKVFTTSLYGAAAVALALAAAPAHAAAISGTNLDFESPVGLTAGTDQNELSNFGTTAVPGWTINSFNSAFGDAGVWAPKAGGVFFNNPATWENSQVGFLQTDSNISQNLNGTFTGNAGTVQVTLLLGESLHSPINPADDSITLLANGTAIGGTQTVLSTGGQAPVAGNFVLETYDINLAANALAGDTLGLEISNDSDPGEIFVDDVVVDGTTAVTPNGGGGGGGGGGSSVPEPASLSILGVALLGFAAWRRSSSSGGLVSAA